MTGAENIILPEPTLRRMPWYLAYIEILKNTGVKTVSTTRISRALNVDSSQIAKDLSFLNIKGKTRIGYDISDLVEALRYFLGFSRAHNAILVGVGSLGAALLHDKGLVKYGLNIVAGFDINPEITGTGICGVPVYNVDEMEEVRRRTGAEIGILTVPTNRAQLTADIMVSNGIKAIWNFTPYRVRVAEGIVMANTSIYAHLALIYNRLNADVQY
ncbi:MAG: redox-sensing transcriptional repressor Rex [Prevotella sp.]|nr:redox-sensing transcriptional repressor Rex [Prevotella sp.]MCM1075438.1 redox-sensing transcriptional repressor Rex [Ruminococcus sp.]